MNKFIYKGVIYNSKKELKEKAGLNSTKIKGMLKDNTIKLITNTEDRSYEDNNNKKQQ